MDARCWEMPAHLTWDESDDPAAEYVLTSAGAGDIGSLTRRGWFRREAEGKAASRTWVFQSAGFWDPGILIRERSAGETIAECSRRWTSAVRTIRWHDGNIYHWRQKGWMSDVAELADEAGRCLIRTSTAEARSFRELFRTRGHVETAPTGIDPSRIALLTILSWYLFLLSRDEASAVVVTG